MDNRYHMFCICLLFVSSMVCLAEENELPSREKMWQLIQKQNAEIEELKKVLKQLETQTKTTESMTEDLAELVQSERDTSRPSWTDKTNIGGYGETHLNLGRKDEIDFHRFVLFISHRYNDRIHFFSELELEHSIAGDGQAGEIELEQAYVDVNLNENHTLRAGLFLIPVGILNETHEPDTFYGVERNPIEKKYHSEHLVGRWCRFSWQARGRVIL